jgi:hypothetical protein
MPWPEGNRRLVDWSFFNNHGWPLHKPFDVDAFCELHPECQGAILRFNWPGGKPDQHYAHYYDGFERNGKIVAGYGWASPFKTASANMELAKIALGERVPKLIGFDYEDVTDWAPTNLQWTNCLRTTWEAQQITFPESEHMSYSRAGWLDSHIIVGDWFHKIIWWLAHWIYPPPDFNRQAKHWSEVERMLPIDNNFTPFRGRVVKIQEENVKGWQISSRGEIVPRGFSDLNLFQNSFIDPIYSGGSGPGPEPGPDPDPDPVDVTIAFPEGKINLEVKET